MKYPLNNCIAYFFLFLIDWLLSKTMALFVKKNSKVARPKKILVCNVAHLGDVLMTTSLLAVLKEAFPEAQLGMLIASTSKAVIENHPLVDEFFLIDHWKVNRKKHSLISKMRRYFQMRKAVLKKLKHASYDLAIDCCFYFPNMAYLLWRANIPSRIGFASAGFGPFLTHAYSWDRYENRSALLAYLSLLEPLSAQKIVSLPRQAPKCNPKENTIVIHMGTGHSQKKWPLNKWKALAMQLAQEGETLLFTGTGAQENQEIEQVMQNLPKAQNLCDTLSWQAFAELIRSAKLLISVETSAGHLASAMQTEAILLYTGIHPLKVWSPIGEKTTVLTHIVPCSPCFKGCKEMLCVRSISVEEVYNAVRSIKPLPTRPAWSSSMSSLMALKGTS